MLYREIIAVRSQIHTKHINTVVLDAGLLNVKPVAFYTVTTSSTKPIRSSHYDA